MLYVKTNGQVNSLFNECQEVLQAVIQCTTFSVAALCLSDQCLQYLRISKTKSDDSHILAKRLNFLLSPLLFIIVSLFEASAGEFRSGVPYDDLCADDLVIIAESFEECVRRLLIWKEAKEEKALTANAGKAKIMICGTGLDLLQSSSEFPCVVCRTRVGSNNIFCNSCKHWVHKKCSGLKRLTKDPDYRCTWCQGTAGPLDGRPQRKIYVGPDKLEVVASVCYLDDMLSAAGGCELSTTTRVKTAWKKFKELLPVLSLSAAFLSRHVVACTALVCGAQCSMPVRLAIDKAKPPTSAAK